MAFPDPDFHLTHFRAVQAFAERLAPLGIALMDHQYLGFAFGHWTMVVAHDRRRIRIAWDGRDGYLSLGLGTVSTPDESTRDWKPIHDEQLGVDQSSKALEVAERIVRERIAA